MKGIQYVACIPAALLILAAKVAHGYVQVQGYFELQDEYEDYYTDEQIQIDGKWIYTVASNIPDGFEYYYSDDGRRLIEKFNEGRHLQSKSNMEDKVYGCKDFGLENIDNHRDFASWLKFAFESEYSVELIDDPNLPYGSQYDYQEENPIAYFNTANKDLTGPFKGRETMWIVDCISPEKIYFEREYRANPLEVKGFFELQDNYEDYYTDEDVQINGEWIYIVASNIPDGFNNLYDNESDNYYYDYYRKLKKYEEPNPNESLILPYPNEEIGIYGCKDFGLNDIDNGQNGIYHSNYSLETINDPTLPYGSQYDFKNEKEYFNTANKGELGPFTGNDGMWIVDCTLPEKAYFGENNCPEGNFFDTTTNRCFPITEFPSESPNATPSLTISSSPSSSPVASPVAQPSPTPQNDCSDSPIGWHDTDGVAYNCQWYAQGAYCQDYGDHYADANGITANMACCACGGGTTNQPPSNPQTNVPTKAPTLSPTSSPTATPSLTISSSPSSSPVASPVAQPSPTPQNDCSDSPIGWHDTDGVAYNCQWYAQGAYCQDYGDHYADANGITANMACCACGGGTTNQPPSNPQTNLPTKAPTLSPTSSPTATPSLTISSSPSSSPVASPVAQPSPTPQNDCSDSPIGWHDTDGVAYNCQWYAQGAYCQDYGDHYADANGITANMACCACGGGTTNQPPSNPQTNVPTKAPTLSPTSSPTATPSLTISVSPSQAPTGTKVVCADDKDATFPLSNSNKSADCEWITKNKKRAEARKKKYCRLDYVKKICPMTCSMCPTK